MKQFSKLVSLFVVTLFFCTSASGQTKKGDVWSGVGARLSAFGGKEKQHVELAYTLGYNFTDRFSSGIVLEDAVSLFENDGAKDHYMNVVGGAKLAYKVLQFSKSAYSLQGGAGATLDNQAWKYVYYDLSMSVSHPVGKVEATIGYGFRYYDSMRHSFGNHWSFYISFGCVLPM